MTIALKRFMQDQGWTPNHLLVAARVIVAEARLEELQAQASPSSKRDKSSTVKRRTS